MNEKYSNICVVVTGFDVFSGLETNPSWEAVNILKIPTINLIKQKIKVSYEEVNKTIPNLWKKHKPCFMIHVGVSCLAKQIVLEKCAHSYDYNKLDEDQCLPNNGCYSLDLDDDHACNCLHTKFDLEKIRNKLNKLKEQGKLNINATISNDAGRFLCEYIYFASLKCSENNSLFVHIPKTGTELGYTIEDLRDAIQAIIEYLIENYQSNKLI